MKTLTPIHILALIGLLSGINTSRAQPLDKQAIKAIDLQLARQTLVKWGLTDTNALRAAVIGNLSQWRFPLPAGNGQAYTHTLTVEIGDSKYDQTPVGFSFSSGNSDPRAPGFQKAQVIPIQCRLSANANPDQHEELDMTFSAPSSPINTHKLQESLIENISSVCFDLLDSLKFLPPPTAAQAAATISKPTWMPSVQVETVPIPQPQPKPENLPAATASPATATATPPPATQEPQEPRQQLIIHNQGTPMILKFGHERR